MNMHSTIHNALVAALAKHGQSNYGVVAAFDSVGVETKITGFYKLKFVSEDVAKAVQAKLVDDAEAVRAKYEPHLAALQAKLDAAATKDATL